MSMLKVQCNILNYYQPEGSRSSYVQNFHSLQFRTECRKSLWTFSCDIWKDIAMHLPLYGIWTYPQIIPNVNIFIIGWKNICSTSEAWNLQHRFGFFCVYFGYKPCLVFICLCPRCIWFYIRNIITTIFRSKYEIIRYILY